jgi:hypothetical protein
MLGTIPVASAPLTSLLSTVTTQAIQDSITFSEVLTKRYDKTVADTLTVSDSATGIKFGGISVTDFITFQEKLIRQYPPFIDGLNLTELLTVVVVNKRPALVDSIAFTENIKAQRIVSITVAELLSLSEQARRGLQIQPQDRINFLDIIATVALKKVAVADAIQYRETINIVRPAKFLADSIDFKETIEVGGPVRQSITDTITLTDTINNRILGLQKLVDTLTMSDQVDNTFGKLTVKDVLTISEILKVNAVLAIEFCDKLILVEKANRVRTGSITDSLTILDATRFTNIVDRLIFTETLITNALTDSCNDNTYVPQKGKTDSLAISETIKVNIVKRISISDSLSLKGSVAWR